VAGSLLLLVVVEVVVAVAGSLLREIVVAPDGTRDCNPTGTAGAWEAPR